MEHFEIICTKGESRDSMCAMVMRCVICAAVLLAAACAPREVTVRSFTATSPVMTGSNVVFTDAAKSLTVVVRPLHRYEAERLANPGDYTRDFYRRKPLITVFLMYVSNASPYTLTIPHDAKLQEGTHVPKKAYTLLSFKEAFPQYTYMQDRFRPLFIGTNRALTFTNEFGPVRSLSDERLSPGDAAVRYIIFPEPDTLAPTLTMTLPQMTGTADGKTNIDVQFRAVFSQSAVRAFVTE